MAQVLYWRYEADLHQVHVDSRRGGRRLGRYRPFCGEVRHYPNLDGIRHVACGPGLRRAAYGHHARPTPRRDDAASSGSAAPDNVPLAALTFTSRAHDSDR